MSPIASYQSAQDLSSEALTAGGIQSPFVSIQYPEDFSGAALNNGGISSPFASYLFQQNYAGDVLANGGAISPFVSYQYPNRLDTEILTSGGVLSPIVSYQYCEWPGSGILNLQSSPLVSYYYQFLTSPGAVVLHGHVTDANGKPLSGATVAAMVYLSPVAQTTTDANGNYQLPAMTAGAYDLSAWDTSYQTSMRGLTLNANTAEQDFQLNLLALTPAMQPVNRQPATFNFPPIGSLGETLKLFNGTQFVAIDPMHTPSPNLMTIVLTHGWIPLDPLTGTPLFTPSGISDWPTTMAAELNSAGVTTGVANIVAWDWRYAAEGTLPPEENTPSEGVFLGQSLQTVLGATYSQPIHFMGHSLGTMVNAAAANYVHGDRTAQQAVSPTPWSAAQTYMTLFDQAEISSVAGVSVLFDGLTVDPADPTAVLKFAAQTLQQWKPSMPVQSAWADNYISLVGFYLPNTFNIALEKAEGYAGGQFWQAHDYPMVWYGSSIANPTDTPLGFQQSYEYDKIAKLPSSTFPSALYQLGDAYHQVPSASDQLALEPLPDADVFQAIVPLFGNGADVVVQGAVGVVQFAGNVTSDVENEAQQTGQAISQDFNYVNGVAAQGGQTVVNFFDTSVLHLTLTTTPPTTSNLQVQNGLVRPMGTPHDNTASNTAPMIWLPIQIPANASAMAFDFTVNGDPMDDWLVCGIGTNNLFSLEAKYIPTNQISASRLIDVKTWAGATNELFFGFMGGTSTNATLQIDNIRFYSLQAPSLQAQVSGGNLIVTWPLSAANYVLQTSTNLTDTNSWTAVTNVPAIVNLQNTITNPISAGARFYRLMQ